MDIAEPPGTIWGHYQCIREVGKGSFGRVYLARDLRNGQEIAMKLITRGEHVKNYRVYVAREILHHGSLVHPFIVGLYEVILTPKHLGIAMEYADGGDLFKYVTNLPLQRVAEATARVLFQQLIIAVHYMHGRGVANRDLKLENLLLSGMHKSEDPNSAVLKICDFGYSKHEYNSTATTGVGTPVYMSPELILAGNRYDPKRADLWSCGVILYTLLTGTYPFDHLAKDYAVNVVRGNIIPISPNLDVSDSAKHLIGRMIVSDPKHRATVEEIFAHPWFLEGLPENAMHMNTWYFANAPNPTQPPLSNASALVETIVDAAGSIGNDDDVVVSCVFPAAVARAPGT